MTKEDEEAADKSDDEDYLKWQRKFIWQVVDEDGKVLVQGVGNK